MCSHRCRFSIRNQTGSKSRAHFVAVGLLGFSELPALLLGVPEPAAVLLCFLQHPAFPGPTKGAEMSGSRTHASQQRLRADVRGLRARTAPPPARRAAAGAGKGARRGAPAGLCRHYLAVHGSQQQHQTHGPKHIAGASRRHVWVQQHGCHCSRRGTRPQQRKWSSTFLSRFHSVGHTMCSLCMK